MVERLAVLCALVGCNQVFGLSQTELFDSDTSPPDALPVNCHAALYQIDKDAYLLDASPHGLEDATIVDDVHPGLYRFAITYQPGEYIAAAIMHAYVVERANACAASCGACPVGQATKFRVYWNDSSWSDDDATSTNRRATATWDAEFATGSGDRSAQIVESALSSKPGPIDVPIRMVDIAPNLRATSSDWIRYDSGAVPPEYLITLQLHTDAPIVFAAEERDGSSCLDPVAPPSLTLTLCK